MEQGIQLFNSTIMEAVAENKRFLKKRPAYVLPFARIANHIKKAAATRETLAKDEGLVVPPVLILSVTNDCNLACAGCYACSQHRERAAELSMDDIQRIVGEAVRLGVCVVMLAGGEPLLKQGILDLPPAYPDTLFVMFTNGLLLDTSAAQAAARIRNLIPVLSLEGGQELTDERRGAGLYDAVTTVMRRLDSAKRMFGVSVTLTSRNYDDVIRGDYLDTMQALGCRVAFLIEYVPCGAEDETLCLTETQKDHLRQIEKELYKGYDMLVVSLPGNEDPYGGCLASGRGFLHISSTGALEACPFAPWSDVSVKDMPLKQALRSRLLEKIREGHETLRESRGGCALKENAAWVASLQKDSH
jgi:MoaA/NifB/PqqE/SkfB family radical SAM enzyme